MEVAIVGIIVTILLIALTTALKNVVKGGMVAKERTRALALAEDKLAELRKLGYANLKTRISRYRYPDDPDPDVPLSQKAGLPPYPATAPDSEEDPWTPEWILSGTMTYWRHVKVKCVEAVSGTLYQKPLPDGSEAGGTDDSSNLMHIEVAVTWESRLMRRMQQVRVASLVANMAVVSGNYGTIAGTIFDDGPNVAVNTDDSVVKGKPLVVHTTHPGTDESFSTPVNPLTGAYELTSLPDGEYIVKLQGAPEYHDSAYAVGNTGGPPPAGTPVDGNPVPDALPQTVTIGVGSRGHRNIGIWTTRIKAVWIIGRFTGASTGDTIYIESGDGLSSATQFTVDTDCTAGSPCNFWIPQVVWPSIGTKTFVLTIENKTQQKFGTATLCVDSAIPFLPPNPGVTATNFYWGYDPHPAWPVPCGACAAPCQMPAWSAALSATQWDNTPGTVMVVVREYYNGGDAGPLEGAWVGINDGGSGPAQTDGTGVATIAGVTPSPAGSLKISAWMSGTGYSDRDLAVADTLNPGAVKWANDAGGLGDAAPTTPPYTILLHRVAIVSGTVWRVCDGDTPPCDPDGSQGFPNASVTITNPETEFNVSVVTDAAGRFSCEDVIQESSDYTVRPSVGTNFSVAPTSLGVTVDANGVTFSKSDSNEPLEFVLAAINGTILGRVMKKVSNTPLLFERYEKGAIVIATTYGGAFPAELPSGTLAGTYSYSAITETDGSFTLKVATGVGDYTIYAFSPDGEAPAVGPYDVPSDSEVTAADLVIDMVP